MADNKRTFILRVISGLFAGFGLLGAYLMWGPLGLQVACSLAIVLGIREFTRIAFRHWQMPRSLDVSYWLICAVIFVGLQLDFSFASHYFAIGNVLLFISALWLTRGRVSNDNLMAAVAMGCFGLLYCLFFPYYTLEIIALNKGPQWFLLLLLIVFFGDTFAYFGGRWLGRHKMMVMISPNKTWEGSLAGILGSALAGGVQLNAAFPNVPWIEGLAFSLVCGLAAQSGDLLVSLIKRVAHVKDSGHIMPGHGGVLDRLDGIYIACPLVYCFALYVTTHFGS